jgi:hypothetical protein
MKLSPPIQLVTASNVHSRLSRPRLRQRTSGGYVLCWCATSFRRSTVHARVLDREFNFVGSELQIDVHSSWTAAAIAPLYNDGFVLAWSDRDRILTRIVSDSGDVSTEIALDRNEAQIPNLEVEVFPNGGIAVSWQHKLIIIPPGSVPLLSALTPDAWHATIAFVDHNQLLRLHSGRAFNIHEPIYPIDGSIYEPSGVRRSNFQFRTPTRIIGNTYAHPEHPAAIGLKCGFVAIWTDLAHHHGNSIRALTFDLPGLHASQPTRILASSAEDEHVGRASVVQKAKGELLVGWLRGSKDGYSFVARAFCEDLQPLGDTFTVAPATDSDEGSLLRTDEGEVIAIWEHENAIFVTRIKSIPQ